MEATGLRAQDGNGMDPACSGPANTAACSSVQLAAHCTVKNAMIKGAFTGPATGFFNGRLWRTVDCALQLSGKNDILSTPSAVTLDNSSVVQRGSGCAGAVRFSDHQRRQRL